LGKPRYVPPAIRRAVIEEFRRDPRPCAVANKFGIHHRRVKTWLAEAGLIEPVKGEAERGKRKVEPAVGRPGVESPEPTEERGMNAAVHAGNDPTVLDGRARGGYMTMPRPGDGDSEVYKEEIGLAKEHLEQAKTELTDGEIKQLYREAERAYLFALLNPAQVAKADSKDAAAVAKALRETVIRMDEREKAERPEEESDGLKAWERVMLRILADTHPADEEWEKLQQAAVEKAL
jgi:hypothetical protein